MQTGVRKEGHRKQTSPVGLASAPSLLYPYLTDAGSRLEKGKGTSGRVLVWSPLVEKQQKNE